MELPSKIIWEGMKFPSQWKMEGEIMAKPNKCGLKCTDPLGLKAFKAGVSGKKLKKVM
jgi:hypothetical protein